MAFNKLRIFRGEDLRDITDGFSKENFITNFQYGSVFHGNLQRMRNDAEDRKVTVKIWDESNPYYPSWWEDNICRLKDEITLSKHIPYASHPSLVKVLGYCEEDELLGVVYDLASLDTLHNIMLKDDFGWLQRMKVAIQFAYLLQFLHAPDDECSLPCLIRNLDAFHIMVDTDGNAVLYDFALVSGGIFPDRRKHYPKCLSIGDWGCTGYVDPDYHESGTMFEWSDKTDVFDFGIILICLIAKKRVHPEDIREKSDPLCMEEWARIVYQPNCSLVDHRLEAQKDFVRGDGIKITKLAMHCTELYRKDRPTMKEVVDVLLDLHVTKSHALTLAIDPRLLHDVKFQQAVYIRDQRFLYIKKRNKDKKLAALRSLY